MSEMKKVLSENLVFLFLCFFVFILPFLDGGTSFLAESLLLVLPLPLFLFYFSLKGKIRLPSPYLLFFFLGFLSFCALSLPRSASLSLSVPKFFELLSLFLFFVLFLQVASKENLKVLVYTILVASFILCLLSFYYLLPNAFPPKSSMNLVYAVHGHNRLAEYLSFALPISLALFIKSKKTKSLFGVLTVFYFISLLFTFSRTSLLLLPLVSFLVIKKLKPKEKGEKITSWLLVILPLFFAFLIFLLPFTKIGKKVRKSQPYDWFVRQTVKPLKGEKRLEYWPQAIEGFKKRPFFGWGIGTFRLISQRLQKHPASWSWFTHNFYLQILAEAGILAFLSFLGFLILALRQVGKIVKEAPFPAGSFFALIFSSLHSLFDFDWEFPAVFLTFFALLAFLVEKKYYSKKGEKLLITSLFFFAFLTFLFGSSKILGEIHFQEKDYEKSLRLYPFSRENWLLYATIGGEKVAQKAIFFNQEDSSLYSLLGEGYKKRGEEEKAEKMFKKVASLNPLSPTAWQKLERIYEKLGKEEEKIILYQALAEKIKFVEPESQLQGYYAKTLYKLGLYFYEKERNLQKTALYWQEAVRIAPQWSYFHLELANLYAERGDREKAKRILEHCLEFYHPREHCREHLEGEAWQELGSWRETILAIPD